MFEKDIVSWNLMILVYVINGFYGDVFEFFYVMLDDIIILFDNVILVGIFFVCV